MFPLEGIGEGIAISFRLEAEKLPLSKWHVQPEQATRGRNIFREQPCAEILPHGSTDVLFSVEETRFKENQASSNAPGRCSGFPQTADHAGENAEA